MNVDLWRAKTDARTGGYKITPLRDHTHAPNSWGVWVYLEADDHKGHLTIVPTVLSWGLPLADSFNEIDWHQQSDPVDWHRQWSRWNTTGEKR